MVHIARGSVVTLIVDEIQKQAGLIPKTIRYECLCGINLSHIFSIQFLYTLYLLVAIFDV